MWKVWINPTGKRGGDWVRTNYGEIRLWLYKADAQVVAGQVGGKVCRA